ncbi:MAG: co-chaperone GroES [Patescibacteria group bacterium]|nr:co-chaperone GroES [Patescibacteria group bacterium]
MEKLKLQPLGSRLIVRPIAEKEVTKSGIILPETADKDRPVQGEVLVIGPGKTLENGQREKIDLKVGDKILFEKYGADEYKVNEQEFLVVDYEKVVAVIK